VLGGLGGGHRRFRLGFGGGSSASGLAKIPQALARRQAEVQDVHGRGGDTGESCSAAAAEPPVAAGERGHPRQLWPIATARSKGSGGGRRYLRLPSANARLQARGQVEGALKAEGSGAELGGRGGAESEAQQHSQLHSNLSASMGSRREAFWAG